MQFDRPPLSEAPHGHEEPNDDIDADDDVEDNGTQPQALYVEFSKVDSKE